MKNQEKVILQALVYKLHLQKFSDQKISDSYGSLGLLFLLLACSYIQPEEWTSDKFSTVGKKEEGTGNQLPDQ